MGKTRNFMLPLFVLVVLALFAGMSSKVQPVRSNAFSQQEARVEMAVRSAVNSVEGVGPEYKQVMLQIMDTTSDN